MANTITPASIPFKYNDCFLIAVLRGLLHVPSLREHFYAQVPELQRFEQNPDCQDLRRRVLVPLGQRRMTQGGHDDAVEALDVLGRSLDARTNALFFQERIQRHFNTRSHDGARTDHTDAVRFKVEVMIREATETQTLIKAFQESRFPTLQHDPEGAINSERFTFLTAPNTLLLTVKRFATKTIKRSFWPAQWEQTILYKIKTPLEVEPTFQMGRKFSEDGQPADYDVVYGAIHSGTIYTGHYNAVVKIGEQWFLDTCFGRPMKRISEGDAMKKLRDAYIICLERNDLAAHPRPPVRGSLPSDREMPPDSGAGAFPTSGRRRTGSHPRPSAPSSQPPPPGREVALPFHPVGVRNDKSECSLTAVFQLLINTPLYHTMVVPRIVSETGLDRFMQSYREAETLSNRHCSTVRKELFKDGAIQDYPQKTIEYLGLPKDYVLRRGKAGEIPPNTLGAVYHANKFVAVVRHNNQWYILDNKVTLISDAKAKNLLTSPKALLVTKKPTVQPNQQSSSPTKHPMLQVSKSQAGFFTQLGAWLASFRILAWFLSWF